MKLQQVLFHNLLKLLFQLVHLFFSKYFYTLFTTKEYPPENLEEFQSEKKESRFIPDLLTSLKEMPSTMKKLGLIQFFSWFAFFTMWSLATPALTEHVFNAPKPDVKEYAQLNTEGEVLKQDKKELFS